MISNETERTSGFHLSPRRPVVPRIESSFRIGISGPYNGFFITDLIHLLQHGICRWPGEWNEKSELVPESNDGHECDMVGDVSQKVHAQLLLIKIYFERILIRHDHN